MTKAEASCGQAPDRQADWNLPSPGGWRFRRVHWEPRIGYLTLMSVLNDSQLGVGCLATGIVLLLIAPFSPLLPVVTAMALVIAGATLVTIDRWESAPNFLWIGIFHLGIYGAIFILAWGARLDASVGGPHLLVVGDLAVASAIVAWSGRQMLFSLLDDGDGRPC